MSGIIVEPVRRPTSGAVLPAVVDAMTRTVIATVGRRASRTVVGTIVVVVAVACSAPAPIPSQPIAFDHALHLRLDLDGKPLACTACHAGAERAEHAGLPAARDCLRCHMRPQGKGSPGEARVRELAAAGQIQWIQITRNPGHVYAPHRAHVGIAKLPCAECHGDVTAWTEPPTEPIDRLRHMTECIECHRAHDAPTTCGTCHR